MIDFIGNWLYQLLSLKSMAIYQLLSLKIAGLKKKEILDSLSLGKKRNNRVDVIWLIPFGQ